MMRMVHESSHLAGVRGTLHQYVSLQYAKALFLGGYGHIYLIWDHICRQFHKKCIPSLWGPSVGLCQSCSWCVGGLTDLVVTFQNFFVDSWPTTWCCGYHSSWWENVYYSLSYDKQICIDSFILSRHSNKCCSPELILFFLKKTCSLFSSYVMNSWNSSFM